MARKFSRNGVALARLLILNLKPGRATPTQSTFWPKWNGNEPYDTLSLSDAEAMTKCTPALCPPTPSRPPLVFLFNDDDASDTPFACYGESLTPPPHHLFVPAV